MSRTIAVQNGSEKAAAGTTTARCRCTAPEARSTVRRAPRAGRGGTSPRHAAAPRRDTPRYPPL